MSGGALDRRVRAKASCRLSPRLGPKVDVDAALPAFALDVDMTS